MGPHYCQSSRENATPSSGTSPLARYKEVTPPPLPPAGFQMQICSIVVDFGKVLCSSANELQQNSNASCREEYIPQY